MKRPRAIGTFLPIVCAAAWLAPAQPADLLVLNKIRSGANLERNLIFVDLASGWVVTRIPVGKEPHEVAAPPDGRFAVVTNTGSYGQAGNTLSVIDVAARKEIHRVELGPLWNPHGIVVQGGLFYFTAEGARAIAAYDAGTNRVVWIMGTGQGSTHMLAFNPDGKSLVTTYRGSGNVSVFDSTGADSLVPGGWKETIVPACEGPEGVDIRPDGREAWVGCHGSNGITIVDLAQKKMTASFATNTRALARVKFAFGGKYLLATDPSNGELVIFDAASRQELKRLKLGAASEAIFPERDARHVLIGVTNEDDVAEVDLETMSIVRRFNTGQGPDGMAWIGK